jgi:hypothetical protein
VSIQARRRKKRSGGWKKSEIKAEGIADIPVVVGGIIPRAEEKIIKDIGVKEVFHPYSPLETIVERVKAIVAKARKIRSPIENLKPFQNPKFGISRITISIRYRGKKGFEMGCNNIPHPKQWSTLLYVSLALLCRLIFRRPVLSQIHKPFSFRTLSRDMALSRLFLSLQIKSL